MSKYLVSITNFEPDLSHTSILYYRSKYTNLECNYFNDLDNKITKFRVQSGYYSMGVYTHKKSGELNYLTPHAFCNITDFGAKCERCETINTIALGMNKRGG